MSEESAAVVLKCCALREMETPRLERYITNPTNSVFITYTSIEEFGWDRVVLSDWLLPWSEVVDTRCSIAIPAKSRHDVGRVEKVVC